VDDGTVYLVESINDSGLYLKNDVGRNMPLFVNKNTNIGAYTSVDDSRGLKKNSIRRVEEETTMTPRR
jgi:hypothetical protein